MSDAKQSAAVFKLVSAYANPGCLHGLLQPTAIGIVEFKGDLPGSDLAFDRELARLIGSCFPDLKVLPERGLHGPVKPAVSRRLQLVQNIADVAVALQLLTGFPVTRGVALRTGQADVLHFAIPYYNAKSADDAIRLAVDFVAQAAQLLADDTKTDEDARTVLKGHIETYKKQHDVFAPAAGTVPFVRIAEQRNVPWQELVGGIIQLGHGYYSNRFFATFTDQTSNIAARIARQKLLSSNLLRSAGFPVPAQVIVRDEAGALKAAEQLGYPVVIKPADEDGGVGVFAGLKTEAAVKRAFSKTSEVSKSVLMERHVDGDDYRLLVINGRMVSAVRRLPGAVTGDGKHSIRELIDIVNQDPRRGETKTKLVKLSLDDEALDLIAEAGYEPETVLPEGEFFALRRRANLSTGGTPESASDIIHPDNSVMAERAARIVGLDIAGVDYLTTDISKSWKEVGGAICEVNGQPVLRPHWFADPEAKVNDLIIDHLMPKGNGRIPVTAVTGTNGKSTTCQMLHHIIAQMGVTSGVSTTQGVWIGAQNVSDKNMSGFPGGHMLLTDKKVHSAIIEMPVQSLLSQGFPFDHCTVAGITNIQDDHIGTLGISSKDAMARIKSSVLERAQGAIVINADDPLTLSLGLKAPQKRKILVSTVDKHEAINTHVASGGIAVVVNSFSPQATICRRSQTGYDSIVAVTDIPATDQGKLRANVFNAVFATGLALGLDVPIDVIARGLKAFENSPTCNPGRFTKVGDLPCPVIVDYAQNVDALRELCHYVSQLPCGGKKRLLVNAFGGRQRQAVPRAAPIIAQTFDEIAIALDPATLNRDRSYGQMDHAQISTHFADELKKAGVPASAIRVEVNTEAALATCVSACAAHDVLVVNSSAPSLTFAQLDAIRASTYGHEAKAAV